MNPSSKIHAHGEHPTLHFVKYTACGNDFIVIESDSRAGSLEMQAQSFAQHAPFLCDRHRGIGADGILLLHREQNSIQAYVINSDGSFAQNCGNGLRCCAHWGWLNKCAEVLTIELAGRHYRCIREGLDVKISMGEAQVKQGPQWDFFSGASFYADVGNQHVIFLADQLPDSHLLLPAIQQSFADWQHYNLGFLARDTHRSVVYERGVGFTESCGSGAIAAAMALWLDGDRRAEYQILQPGGTIKVMLNPLLSSLTDATFSVVQSGEAEEVFHGSLVLKSKG